MYFFNNNFIIKRRKTLKKRLLTTIVKGFFSVIAWITVSDFYMRYVLVSLLCAHCLDTARPVDDALLKYVIFGNETLKVVTKFFIIRGMLSGGNGCELVLIER